MSLHQMSIHGVEARRPEGVMLNAANYQAYQRYTGRPEGEVLSDLAGVPAQPAARQPITSPTEALLVVVTGWLTSTVPPPSGAGTVTGRRPTSKPS
jgi:hypothetical protein